MKSFNQILFFAIMAVLVHDLVKYLPMYDPIITASQLARQHGYEIEEHFVTTKDGYILENHRLKPKNRFGNPLKDKKVVVLNHGLMTGSNIWLSFSPERALGYYLSDRGYDVWMLNTRGNYISQGHVNISASDNKYWDHSYHEMGIYDVPQSIDYILKVTQASAVDFVGYSMGATTFFIMMSENNTYSEKITNMVSLGPAVFNVDVMELLPAIKYISKLIQKLVYLEVTYVRPTRFDGYACHNNDLFSRITCQIGLASFSMLTDKNLNLTEFRDSSLHVAGSTAGQTLIHYHQNKLSGKFTKYDYGERVNLEKYGSIQPPEYDLSKATTPMAVFWSDGDYVCPAEASQRLLKLLPNVVLEHRISDYNHGSFYASTNAKDMNEKIYQFLEQRHRIQSLPISVV